MDYTLIAVEGAAPVVFLFGLVIAIYLVFQYASRESAVAQEIRSDEGIPSERPETSPSITSDAPNAPSDDEVKKAVDQIEDKASMLNDLIARAERAAERLEPTLDHPSPHPQEPSLNESNHEAPAPDLDLEEGSLDDLIAELEAESDLGQPPDDFLMNLATDLETEKMPTSIESRPPEYLPPEEGDVNVAVDTHDQIEASTPPTKSPTEDVEKNEKCGAPSDELASALNALRELTEEARRFCEDDATESKESSSQTSVEEPHDTTLDKRFRAIYQFADEGLTPWAIARRVGAPVGKIELILGLRGVR